MRRPHDFVLSAILLTILSPLLLFVAVAILVMDGRPVLFRQVRIGKDGQPFELLKFRTMTYGDGPAITVGNDPRITRVGSILRRYKLDELPQLVNVLVGDMSIIGPRPEVPKYVSRFPEQYRQVLKARPGISDPASILYSNEQEVLEAQADPEAYYVDVLLPQKLELSLNYLQTRSLASDIRIMGCTIGSILKDRVG